MALQVWLPLINNVENQGVSNIPIINNGVTFVDNGKIGNKCASFNGNYFSLQNLSNFNTISVSFWMKPANTSQTGCLLNYRASVGVDLAIFLIDKKIRFDAGGQTIFNYTYTTDWQHVTVTYDGNIKSLYINGILNQSVTVNKSISCSATKGTVGASSANTTSGRENNYIGLLNDYRIYDHCLSPKEVKEISKGLVLHYPLNDAYVEGTTNLGNASSSYSDKTEGYEYTANSWGGDAGTVTYYKSGGYNNLPYKVYHKTASGNGGIYGATKRDISITAGKTYTMSIWVKASRNFSAIHYSFNINGITSTDSNHYITYGKNVPFTTEWTRLSRTFTATELDAGIYTELSIIYDNWDTDYYVYFSGFQIEEKDHATPYTPNTRNETTVYDCSGYQNNGTITGALSCSVDSPRYKISTHFTSSIPSRIMLPSDMSCLSGNNEQTLSCWVKSSGLGSGMSFSGLIALGYGNSLFLDGSGYCYGIDNGTDLNYIRVNKNPHDGKWHLVTATYKSGIISIYIDGILKNSTSRTFSNRYINNGLNCIGTEANNINIHNINGDISDVRMYATALSAEDIKELYNTSAYVSDNGTLLTYSVEE